MSNAIKTIREELEYIVSADSNPNGEPWYVVRARKALAALSELETSICYDEIGEVTPEQIKYLDNWLKSKPEETPQPNGELIGEIEEEIRVLEIDIAEAKRQLANLCKTGGKDWTMCIPVRDSDTDMVYKRMIEYAEKYRTALSQQAIGDGENIWKKYPDEKPEIGKKVILFQKFLDGRTDWLLEEGESSPWGNSIKYWCYESDLIATITPPTKE